MFIPKRPTKRERLAAIMAEIDTSGIRELPEAEGVSMVEDGAVLVGNGWTLPSDYADDEIRRGELASLKGDTPAEWPTLDGDQVDHQAGDQGTHFSRNEFLISQS